MGFLRLHDRRYLDVPTNELSEMIQLLDYATKVLEELLVSFHDCSVQWVETAVPTGVYEIPIWVTRVSGLTEVTPQ